VDIEESLYIRKVIREVRDSTNAYVRECRFRRALSQISALPLGEFATPQILKRLWTGWGNQSYSGHPEYLEEVVRRAATISDPVLECGSGLTTILLGLFAGRRGVKIWTLEHDPEWYERIASVIRRFNIKGVELVLAPLRNYGEFVWYDAPVDRMPQWFSLVVCDGPPQRTTKGDRYGLLPVMRDRLNAGSVILFDDVKTEGPDPIISRWVQETKACVKTFSSRPSDSYAVIVIQ
jgi:predicted O-methyltransferase YrrM